MKRTNPVMKYPVDNPVSLKFPKLNLDTIRVIVFSDASFANNYYITSQLGHIVFIAAREGNAAPIYFKSYKALRVTCSVMAAEFTAFSDAFDMGYSLAIELSNVLGRKVPLILLTDSKSLFDVIWKGIPTSEKRMMSDIAAAREGYRRGDISNIHFVRSSKNLADGLTKPMNEASVLSVLRSGKLCVEPDQWIIREKG